MKSDFLRNGFTKNEQLISMHEVEKLRLLYSTLLNDKKLTIGLRSDLGGFEEDAEMERITQIMRPSLVLPELGENVAYELAKEYARNLLGNDMELDFDMLINKAPHTDTPIPWHQDAAYWIKMPDKRSVSCWIALDDVYEENGCMWFIPKGNDFDVLEHAALPNNGALYCTVDDSIAQCVPLKAGGCTFHDGFTLHFSKGNITSGDRRALILNFRPQKMIDLERAQGFDHTGEVEIRNRK